MDLVKPKRLREGDTIRLVAPASSIKSLSKKDVDRGLSNLMDLGFDVEVSSEAFTTWRGTAGPAKERARVIMEGFTDPDVDGLMCVWGGYNSNDLLEYLDWRLIRENSKPFIGYSDITALNNALLSKSGLVTFQGPAFITFCHYFLMPWEVDKFKKILMDGEAHRYTPSPTIVDDPFYWRHPETPVEETANPGWTIINEGVAEGRLVGGHLGTLLLLAGTEYWPDMKGAILFVESDEEDGPPINILRQFRQLRHLGVFDEIEALLIGRIPSCVGLEGDLSLPLLLEDVLTGADMPVVSGMDFGHTNPIMTLPVGVEASIDTDKRALTLLMPGVR
ncbi:LD-carboxypeptidase [Candidatus Bathyarchaeota archaeon]|nr:LD-carboxypeptidase [Candidatus Bathyarchaeota archaeon]